MTTRRRARHSRFIFVGADKVGMNSLRLLDLGLLVLGLLGLLPLLLCGLLGGVVVVDAFLLTNRTPLIDGFGALNIYEVSYVEQKLKEIKSAFKKDYDRNIQYVKFFKKVNRQVKTEVNEDVKGGAKGRKKK